MSARRNGGVGGMQTAASRYSIICPKCGRPATRREETSDGSRYLHFTKQGVVWHVVALGGGVKP